MKKSTLVRVFAGVAGVTGVGLASLSGFIYLDDYFDASKPYLNALPKIDVNKPVTAAIYAHFVKTGNKAAIKAFKPLKRDADKLDWTYRHQPDVMAAVYESYTRTIINECDGKLEKCSPFLQKQVEALYRSYQPGSAFDKWDQDRETLFLDCTALDPAFANIRKRWVGMSYTDRQAILQRVAHWHAYAYSDGAVQIPEPHLFDVAESGKILGFTFESPVLLKYFIAITEASIKDSDFDKVAETAIHEARHVWQRALKHAVKRTEGLKWAVSKNFQSQASIFRATSSDSGYVVNVGAYQRLHDVWYRLTPIEAHARLREDAGADVGRMPKKGVAKCPAIR